MQKDTDIDIKLISISTESPERNSSKLASSVLRARCFPRSHSSHTPTLSRSSTAADALPFRSSESLNEQSYVQNSCPNSSAAQIDSYLTVIYPPAGTPITEKEVPEEPQYRSDAVRAQVRVEGYFQLEDDMLGMLIPNDLPRSTFLYVLTASEGRDKVFKCLQYGFQALICLIKNPRLLSPYARVHADFWAERLWRNSNTIRHGRGLFKLGRWLMNIYYLHEVWERLAMKHGFAVRSLLRRIRASLMRIFPWDSTAAKRTSHAIESPSATIGLPNASGSLFTDDTYTHVARVECLQRGKLHQSPSHSAHDNACDKKSMDDGILQSLEANNLVNCNSLDMSSQKDGPLYKLCTKVRQQHLEMLQKEEEVKSKQGQTSDKSIECKDDTQSAASLMESPPSVQLTLPATQQEGGAQVKRNSPLLKPLCSPVNEEVLMESHVSQETELVDTSKHDSLSLENVERTFDKYQTLPYATRMEDTFPNVFTRESNINKDDASGSNATSLHQGNDDDRLDNDEVGMNGLEASSPQDFRQGVGSGDAFAFRHRDLNDSEVSINSSTTDLSGEMRSEEELIPAETAHPLHWRKRVLDFSTPLMVLLGVRSAATIGRRFMNDVLLLSSKRFLNFLFVEQNRSCLQKRANWLWLIVSCIDLLLNTVRLANRGWCKYASVGQSGYWHCACAAENSRDKMWRSRGLLARRNANLAFPPLDLDFGAPLVSSAAYFEAAAPEHMAPVCRACGYRYMESRAKNEKDRPGRGAARENSQRDNAERGIAEASRSRPSTRGRAEVVILLIPWLMRKFFNYVWLLRTHPNWTETLILQVRYMAEVYLAFKHCFGGYETGMCDAPLESLLHPYGALAGLLGALISLHRVIESAPK